MKTSILIVVLILSLVLFNLGYSRDFGDDTSYYHLEGPVPIPEDSVNSNIPNRQIPDLIPEKISYEFSNCLDNQPTECDMTFSDDSVKIDRILPIVICKVLPSYPNLAMRVKLSGNVTARVCVDTLGKPINVEIRRCDIDLFAEPVIGAVKGWTFAPFYEDYIPRQFLAELVFKFRIHNKRFFVIPPE